MPVEKPGAQELAATPVYDKNCYTVKEPDIVTKIRETASLGGICYE